MSLSQGGMLLQTKESKGEEKAAHYIKGRPVDNSTRGSTHGQQRISPIQKKPLL